MSIDRWLVVSHNPLGVGDHGLLWVETVAELGAAFWCAQFGLEQATRQDHAAYLADWLRILSTDARALVAACGHAQRAVDLLNDRAGWSGDVGNADDGEPLSA